MWQVVINTDCYRQHAGRWAGIKEAAAMGRGRVRAMFSQLQFSF